ncbi:hypothetical protein EVAR_83843_1 [Eumeta japonica]|uniref:Uncharacterized protein n=1 Tax=Eumeta variegata TaxID=151549 RepID=A0A4C1UT00_EUMVA|nr:hypothetical protein EVAR_83843_1 [Eumeta japonica]
MTICDWRNHRYGLTEMHFRSPPAPRDPRRPRCRRRCLHTPSSLTRRARTEEASVPVIALTESQIRVRSVSWKILADVQTGAGGGGAGARV